MKNTDNVIAGQAMHCGGKPCTVRRVPLRTVLFRSVNLCTNQDAFFYIFQRF